MRSRGVRRARVGRDRYGLCGVRAVDGFGKRACIRGRRRGQLMIEEAGGAVTYYDGSPFNIYAPPICASNGSIHEQMLDVLR